MPTIHHKAASHSELSAAIRRLAVARGAGGKLPTVRELSQQFAQPVREIDKALLPLERRGLVQRKHGSGIYVTDRIRQKTIGVAFGGDIYRPDYSPFWALLLKAVRDEAGERSLQHQVYIDISDQRDKPGSHTQLFNDLEEQRLDGLLLLSPHWNPAGMCELRASGVPLVVLGGSEPTDWSVIIDWRPLIRRAGSELARQGCRHVGLMMPPSHHPIIEAALRQAGATDVRIDDWSRETWERGIHDASTNETCARLLTRRMIAAAATTPLPDALVSLEDTATRGAITALLQAGLHPGRDIRVITAENKGSSVLEPYAADITRFALHPRACMKAALAMLETLMAGGTPRENPVRVMAGGGETE